MDVTAAATFCATLVDEWARAGVQHAVAAPGSRSTPMALALAADHRIHVQVQHDERAAGFLALGIGLATGTPAVVLTTSGTAAAELHPAVVEAHQAAVPMLVCTADRPPELRDVGAPQAIDQSRLYGTAVRWFTDPGVPDEHQAGTWRSLGARSVLEATGASPGPVHLNLPFREPLIGAVGALPTGRPDGRPWHERLRRAAILDPEALAAAISGRRGVIVAGSGPAPAAALLGERLQWPLLTGPRSEGGRPGPSTIVHADALLRDPGFATDHAPEVVIRIGGPLASKVVEEWLAASGATEVVLGPAVPFRDFGRRAAVFLEGDLPPDLSLPDHLRAPDGWLAGWRAAEAAARQAIDDVLGAHPEPTEPGVARDVLSALPDGSALVMASSMPVRDVEWYAEPRDGVRVLANRGANGIDGVVSTGVGVAVATGAPTAALVGDIAFLHDSNGLLAVTEREVDLTVVVVDNDGGGIFSFLPQAREIDRPDFERLFGTPHGVDVARIAAAHGVAVDVLEKQADVAPAIARAAESGGVKILVVRTDRAANVAVHDEIHAAVHKALWRK